MPTPPSIPAFPYRFLVVTFAVSITIGALIAYFGIHGQLGAGVP
jgi:hypothetical protein